MFNYSVIIPHYNIPDLLMRCLKSIPVSEDIQVIVVDDNSPDAETYQKRYPELSRPYLEFIRTTKGGGAGYARNVGLEHAKGKWLLFADADDFYVEDMYEMINNHSDSNADVIYFKLKAVFSDNIDKSSSRSLDKNQLIDDYFKTGNEILLRTRFFPPWGKMIKREFVVANHFRFEEIKYSNDVWFSVSVGINAKKIEVVDKDLYVITYRQGSLTSSFCQSLDELITRAEAVYRVQKLLISHQIVISPMPMRRYLLKLLGRDRNQFKKYYREIEEIYPSKAAAVSDICMGMGLKFKIKFCFYSLWLWITK